MSAFLIYATGLLLIAVVACAVASAWWGTARVAPSGGAGTAEQQRWRRQKEEALFAIKDAEFDFHLGKLSEADYRQLRTRLEAEAVAAMSALERGSRGDA